MATQLLPRSDVDLFADEVLVDPYPHYKKLRDAAPVVYLTEQDAYALTHFEDVRTALRDWKTFTSTKGVAFNDTMNALTQGVVLTADPPEHDQLRSVLLERLKLRSVRELTTLVDEKAESVVSALVERGSFDAITDLAMAFPPLLVGDLVGIPKEILDKFVLASEATFTIFGPMNDRTEEGLGVVGEGFVLMEGMTKDDLAPGSMGRDLYEAAERGDIPEDMVSKLLWNYWGPGFHTTISAIGNIIYLLSQNPDQWDLLRADPSLIPGACNEGLRYESPIQVWGRTCREEAEVHGYTIPAGARVAVGIAAAHRDERHYPDPDRFDIRRDARDHLAFGHGIHICVGAPLARLEIEAVIRSLAKRIRRIEAGQPVRHFNNTVRSLDSLPVNAAG
jgi:cytochrome P450